MENKEITTIEEVNEIEEANENVAESSSGTLAAVAGIALAGLVGGVVYKFAVKPFLAKRKAAKEDAADNASDDVTVEGEYTEVPEEKVEE